MRITNGNIPLILFTDHIDEGVYNTYILDSDYKSWALLMHCAEKNKSPRYLSSFIMSRERILGPNVISYLREKLPKYEESRLQKPYFLHLHTATKNITATMCTWNVF